MRLRLVPGYGLVQDSATGKGRLLPGHGIFRESSIRWPRISNVDGVVTANISFLDGIAAQNITNIDGVPTS